MPSAPIFLVTTENFVLKSQSVLGFGKSPAATYRRQNHIDATPSPAPLHPPPRPPRPLPLSEDVVATLRLWGDPLEGGRRMASSLLLIRRRKKVSLLGASRHFQQAPSPSPPRPPHPLQSRPKFLFCQMFRFFLLLPPPRFAEEPLVGAPPLPLSSAE